MFGFIKNLFVPKTFKEIKLEYKNKKEKLQKKEKEIEILISQKRILETLCGTIRVGQNTCPELIVYYYKKLLVNGDDEIIKDCHNTIRIYLPPELVEDFNNKISQSVEYKEWKIKRKKEDLEKDFV